MVEKSGGRETEEANKSFQAKAMAGLTVYEHFPARTSFFCSPTRRGLPRMRGLVLLTIEITVVADWR